MDLLQCKNQRKCTVAQHSNRSDFVASGLIVWWKPTVQSNQSSLVASEGSRGAAVEAQAE
eukprot:2088625-Amphidinium_carterae.1